MEKKICVITGGSSGIGLETVKCLKDNCKVYELSRHGKSDELVTHIDCDVTNEEMVKSAINQVIENENRVDILICCAGYGISGAIEFTSLDDAKKQVDVNFFGMYNSVHAVLPQMRKQNSGRIVCISSVAGVISIPFQTMYSVSKYSINAFVCALGCEVKPFGISVCAVMPGDTKTGFTKNRNKITEGDDVYSNRISRSVGGMEKDEQNGDSPIKAGQYISKIALKKKVKPLYTIGFKYKLLTALIKIFPTSFAYKIIYSIYAK